MKNLQNWHTLWIALNSSENVARRWWWRRAIATAGCCTNSNRRQWQAAMNRSSLHWHCYCLAECDRQRDRQADRQREREREHCSVHTHCTYARMHAYTAHILWTFFFSSVQFCFLYLPKQNKQKICNKKKKTMRFSAISFYFELCAMIKSNFFPTCSLHVYAHFILLSIRVLVACKTINFQSRLIRMDILVRIWYWLEFILYKFN